MADNTKIEWADATLNYVNGCTRVSPGCGGPGNAGGCYAERLAATRLRNVPSRAGLAEMTANGPRWTGKINIDDRQLDQALRWRRPRRIFWNAHGDLFHESVPDEAIDRLFAVCALTPHHTHLILTKRAGRMREYVTARNEVKPDCPIANAAFWLNGRVRGYRGQGGLCARPLPNVWLGVSVEDQQRADERIPDLLNTPAAVRFISAEPLLGPVDLTAHLWGRAIPCADCPKDADCGCGFFPRGACPNEPALDWVIAGGESGPGARPMHPAWARSLRDQCAAAGVPFLFKQWGEWIGVPAAKMIRPYFEARDWSDGCTAFRIGKAKAGRLLDGIEHNAFPGYAA